MDKFEMTPEIEEVLKTKIVDHWSVYDVVRMLGLLMSGENMGPHENRMYFNIKDSKVMDVYREMKK
jgi:hypothetical protein